MTMGLSQLGALGSVGNHGVNLRPKTCYQKTCVWFMRLITKRNATIAANENLACSS